MAPSSMKGMSFFGLRKKEQTKDKMINTKATVTTKTEPSSKTLQPVAPAQPKKASSLPTNEGHAVQAVITPLSDAVKPDARVAEVVRPVMEEKLPQEAQSLPTKAPATPSLDAKAESLATAPIAVKPAEPPTAEAKVAPIAPAAPKLTAAQLQAKEDLLAAFGATPRVPIRLLDAYATYMVVGESGLGKTTFIRNLVASFNVATKPHDGSSTNLADFMADPESLRLRCEPMDVHSAGRRLHLSFQDVPGWADGTDLNQYVRALVSFILTMREQDHVALAGSVALNEATMCGCLRHSVTGVLYFLTPHRVKKVDLVLMSVLSQLVTVIPVIAKADTMTESELAMYRKELRAKLATPSKYVGTIPAGTAPLSFQEYSFDSSILTTLGLTNDSLPLAIITSNTTDEVADATLMKRLGLGAAASMEQPTRHYNWGAAHALDRKHSDLIVLKRLLTGDRVDSLYSMLDASYSAYQAFVERYNASGKSLSLMVQAQLWCTAYLEHEECAAARGALTTAQQVMSALLSENKLLNMRLQALEVSKRGH